jgi:hypothetical protein
MLVTQDIRQPGQNAKSGHVPERCRPIEPDGFSGWQRYKKCRKDTVLPQAQSSIAAADPKTPIEAGTFTTSSLVRPIFLAGSFTPHDIPMDERLALEGQRQSLDREKANPDRLCYGHGVSKAIYCQLSTIDEARYCN